MWTQGRCRGARGACRPALSATGDRETPSHKTAIRSRDINRSGFRFYPHQESRPDPEREEWAEPALWGTQPWSVLGEGGERVSRSEVSPWYEETRWETQGPEPSLLLTAPHSLEVTCTQVASALLPLPASLQETGPGPGVPSAPSRAAHRGCSKNATKGTALMRIIQGALGRRSRRPSPSWPHSAPASAAPPLQEAPLPSHPLHITSEGAAPPQCSSRAWAAVPVTPTPTACPEAVGQPGAPSGQAHLHDSSQVSPAVPGTHSAPQDDVHDWAWARRTSTNPRNELSPVHHYPPSASC